MFLAGQGVRVATSTIYYPQTDSITDALSTMLRLLGEELEEASWLMQARFKMELVEPCDEE